MMVDMLSGVLTGSGHLMVAMNIAAFQPLAQFESRMEEFISEIFSRTCHELLHTHAAQR